MWMRSIISPSCCLFPSRSYDLYLKLLVAAPQTLIAGNAKHVTEPEWIWKGRACRLGSGNLSAQSSVVNRTVRTHLTGCLEAAQRSPEQMDFL